MKKILFVALAAAAMVSCSQNEEIENAGQKAEIKIGTVVSKTTRAVIANDATLQTSGFMVSAYNTEKEITDLATTSLGNAFISTFAQYSAGWNLDKIYYWPVTGKTHFFAYAKDDNATNYGIAEGEKYPTISYSVLDNVAQQKDFVVAQIVDKVKDGTNAVALNFTHALTQINFSAKGADAFDYEIESITISGVAKSGKYSFGSKEWIATSGETSGSYSYPLASKVTVNDATKDLMQANGSLMLMPQPMTATSKITVVYKIFSAGVQIGGQTSEIQLNTEQAWEAGKKIRYTLTLANNGANMQISGNVGLWDEPEIPGN